MHYKKKDPSQQVLLQPKKKKGGNIYTIASVGFFLYIYNSNLNILPKFKIVARITLLHLNVLL